MHLRSHILDRIKGQLGRWQLEYHDAMIEHDHPGRHDTKFAGRT